MSRWNDTPEWTEGDEPVDEGWKPLEWILLGGVWNDNAYWVDTEEWE